LFIFVDYYRLRGAVGIALALALDNTVIEATRDFERDQIYSEQTQKLFAFVGGIAFFTLLINATTSGPILKKLGLADPTAVREQILAAVQNQWRVEMINDMVMHLTQPRFRRVNFAVVKEHVHLLSNLTRGELCEAAHHYHEAHKNDPNYMPPYLKNIIPYLSSEESREGLEKLDEALPEAVEQAMHDKALRTRRVSARQSVWRRNAVSQQTPQTLLELRRVFLEIVRSQYQKQIRCGELVNREVYANAVCERC